MDGKWLRWALILSDLNHPLVFPHNWFLISLVINEGAEEIQFGTHIQL